MPTLPDSVTIVNVKDNPVHNILSLPPQLKTLKCSKCGLISLPSLPETLVELYCADNKIINLESLPAGLLYLDVEGNKTLTSLPPLPDKLELLHLGDCNIATLPKLPNSIKSLTLDSLPLQSLPKIPTKLLNLNISKLKLTELPELPLKLEMLDCSDNYIADLTLPSKLYTLNCSKNQIRKIPYLPNLEFLNCSDNLIPELKNLAESLVNLNASHNRLSKFPCFESRDSQIENMNLSYNNISELPVITYTNLYHLDVSYNNIKDEKNILKLSRDIEFFFDGNPVYEKVAAKLKKTDLPYRPRFFKDEIINITKLPKGTVLFRAVTDPKFMMNDYTGYFKNSESKYSYIWPNFNVFFYPYPFVVEQIPLLLSDKTNMITCVLQNDVDIIMGLLPSKNSRNDRYNNEIKYMKPCDKIEISEHFTGNNFDPCLDPDFLRQNKDVIGGLYLSPTDSDAQNVVDQSILKYLPYRRYFQDHNNSVGVPEIILYPFRERKDKEVKFNRTETTSPGWLAKHISEYNYLPVNISKHKFYTDSDFYNFVVQALTPEGYTSTGEGGGGETLHMTIDTLTHFYVIAEYADEATLKRCIPLEEPNKIKFLG
jgi:Leucine-rich repeat (LRR) protein